MSETDQGYAKELTPEQLDKQRQEMAKACARADVVITTAKLFGRKAPLIINNEVLDQMQPGSILIDLAVESGGNVEGSKVGEEVVTNNGVRIIGPENLEGYYPNRRHTHAGLQLLQSHRALLGRRSAGLPIQRR